MKDADFETRVLTLLDGQLSPEEAARLEQDLLASEKARETYEQLVLLHNALESRFEVKPVVQNTAVIPMERLVTDQQRRVVKFSLLAAAALLVISGVVMWLILAPQRVQQLGYIRTSEGSVYSLTYEGEGPAPEGNLLAKGAVIRLQEGSLEGVFDNGARLVAEAPCVLRILAEGRVAQDLGRTWFHVPPAASGFTVQTPEIVAVDLGTEFGVFSNPEGRDEVHVINGSVEVTARLGTNTRETLAAGSAREVDADGRLLEIAVAESRFRKTISGIRRIGIVNHSFEDDVLPRDGDPATKETGRDDYDKSMIPSGWEGFDDGDGGTEGARGVLSTAEDSFFRELLAATPDADENDQVYYSAARDIYQVLPDTLEANSTYVLTVDIGDREETGKGGSPGNPGFRLGFGSAPGEGLLKAVSVDRPDQEDGLWVSWSATFKTASAPEGLGQPLRIELTSGSQVATFDCVRLTMTR